jgi:hypothetical protein
MNIILLGDLLNARVRGVGRLAGWNGSYWLAELKTDSERGLSKGDGIARIHLLVGNNTMKQKYIIQGEVVEDNVSRNVYWSPWHGIDLVRVSHCARVYGSRSECKRVIRNHGCAYSDIQWKIKPLDKNGKVS